MTTADQIAEAPATLEEWRERIEGVMWTELLLKWHPPRWMAVQTQNGTIKMAWISGIRTEWPQLIVEVDGSQLRCEVAFGTLLNCLRGGRPVQI